MAIVFIPTQLRDLTSGDDQVQIDAKTVRQVINALEQRYPGVRDRLIDGSELSPYLQLSVDGALTRRMHTEVGPGSEIHFLPAVGGG